MGHLFFESAENLYNSQFSWKKAKKRSDGLNNKANSLIQLEFTLKARGNREETFK